MLEAPVCLNPQVSWEQSNESSQSENREINDAEIADNTTGTANSQESRLRRSLQNLNKAMLDELKSLLETQCICHEALRT